jgi:hypothetical protein
MPHIRPRIVLGCWVQATLAVRSKINFEAMKTMRNLSWGKNSKVSCDQGIIPKS